MTTDWEKAGILAGIITAGLFFLVLVAQVMATWLSLKVSRAARTSAEAAMHANEQLYTEMEFRLRPCGSSRWE